MRIAHADDILEFEEFQRKYYAICPACSKGFLKINPGQKFCKNKECTRTRHRERRKRNLKKAEE